jgi:hypothetical protein
MYFRCHFRKLAEVHQSSDLFDPNASFAMSIVELVGWSTMKGMKERNATKRMSNKEREVVCTVHCGEKRRTSEGGSGGRERRVF